ncbi:MAG: ABC transporter permease [Phycisphaerae bacterium]
MSDQADSPLWRRGPEAVGRAVANAGQRLAEGVEYVGGVTDLIRAVGVRVLRGLSPRAQRIRYESLVQQSIRFGVRSIPIIALVQLFIGIILALNLAPVLESYGQIERVADVVAIAVVRELGPLITAILLSGFAGASIAAELGAMVEGEEIKALRAHALDPIRFLVAPRVIATTVMMLGLSAMADVVGVLGGMFTAVTILRLDAGTYLDLTRASISFDDYFTGLSKAAVFGLIIASLACYEGLNVRGGAEGVGRATTTTVVKSIVALIAADTIFAAVFYVIGW